MSWIYKKKLEKCQQLAKWYIETFQIKKKLFLKIIDIGAKARPFLVKYIKI